MKFKIMVILLMLLVLVSSAVSAQYLEVALVSDIGGFGDNSYNDQLKESINKVNKDYNISFDFRESELMTEYLENINFFAENKFDLIWSVGFTMEQAVKEAAQMYPEINFVIFDGIVEEENVMSLTFKQEEAGFLAGVTAALESKNMSVGFIGARENDEIKRYQQGFQTGVKSVKPEIKLSNKYVGSFNNFAMAKKITEEMIEDDVDIIFYAAGAASNGIIEAALENDINLITLNSTDINLAPNNVLTAILKNTDKITEEVLEAYYSGENVNEIKEYGIKDNAFIFDKKQSEKLMAQDTLNKIDEYIQQFLAGEINISVQNE